MASKERKLRSGLIDSKIYQKTALNGFFRADNLNKSVPSSCFDSTFKSKQGELNLSKRRNSAKAVEFYAPNKTSRSSRSSTKSNSYQTPQMDHLQLVDSNYIHKSLRQKQVKLIPQSLNQEKYIEALEDDSQHIVVATGPAGSGKTLLATQYAIKCLQEGKIDKIIITRPAVSVDEEHGFLPGTLIEKMAPWTKPIFAVIKEYYHPKDVEKMLEDETIEICPLAYMRGVTFKNAIIIADESQNTTPNQQKMLQTRIGSNSKLIITGDMEQHDRGFEANGLKDFIDRLNSKGGHKNITVIQFNNKDIKRHPIIDVVLDLYKDISDKK